MTSIALFIFNSILFGVGLAMDAFSVSIANSMANPDMHRGERWRIAGAFAFFQFLMPMIGWTCVHTIVRLFESFQLLIPWIALFLLAYIGGNMLREGFRREPDEEPAELGSRTLLLQAVATSIDALSVGFVIAEYPLPTAFSASVIIAAVTLVICLGGIRIGRYAGEKLEGKASILGGLILIGIGLEIWITNIFF